MSHLIDTNVAIRIRDGEPGALARIAAFEQVRMSVVTVVELEGGVLRDPTKAAVRRARLDAMLRRWTVVPFDAAAASEYGRIVAQTGYSRARVMDRMIAASAVLIQATVITANVRDFSDVPGLSLLPW